MRSSTLLSLAACMGIAFADDLKTLLTNTDSVSTLTGIIAKYPDLLKKLNGLEDITIFAPSNDALKGYTHMVKSGKIPSYTDNESDFTNFIFYHSLGMKVMADDITKSPQFLHTMLKDDGYTTVTDGQVVEALIDGDGDPVLHSGYHKVSPIVKADVTFDNGVVHIIDDFLLPPGPPSDTAAYLGYAGFVDAAKAVGLVNKVDSVPDSTIFVPRSKAFLDIGSVLASASKDDITNILHYHVVENTIAYSNSLRDTKVPTLNGKDLTITIGDDGAIFVNSARVLVADILTSSGVVHIIEEVLNPGDTSASATASQAPAFSGASTVPTHDYPLPSGAHPFSSMDISTKAVAASTTVAAGGASGSAGPLGTPSNAANARATGAVGAAMLFGGGMAIAANL